MLSVPGVAGKVNKFRFCRIAEPLRLFLFIKEYWTGLNKKKKIWISQFGFSGFQRISRSFRKPFVSWFRFQNSLMRLAWFGFFQNWISGLFLGQGVVSRIVGFSFTFGLVFIQVSWIKNGFSSFLEVVDIGFGYSFHQDVELLVLDRRLVLFYHQLLTQKYTGCKQWTRAILLYFPVSVFTASFVNIRKKQSQNYVQ